MPNEFHGELSLKSSQRCAIIVSRFNSMITNQLLDGALDALKRSGVKDEHIDIYWVPGAFETPATAKLISDKKKHAGILCLGAVIRGATPHFDYVSGESAKGVANVGMNAGIPVINAILTTDNIEQALERAGTKAGNKGFDGAMALIEMISLYSKIAKSK